MKENLAKEKLRVIDIIKENAGITIAIGGFVWMLYSMVILPIKQLEFNTNDIINNHLKTIQDEQIVASQERKVQGEKLVELNESIIRLEEAIKAMK